MLAVLLTGCSTAPYVVPPHRENDARNSVPDRLASQLQAVLDVAVNANRMPGIQAAVLLPDGKSWTGASGTTDYERREPFRTENLVRIGSITKLYTAAIVVRYVEEGKLRLDDRLSRWIPELARSDEITIEMLLRHTSGLPDTFEQFGTLLRSALWRDTFWTPRELVARHDGPLHFDPGTGWKYSNANYVFLGIVLEGISGRPYHELLRAEILGPYQLGDTFLAPYEPIPDRLVSGFDRDLMPMSSEQPPGQTSWASLAFASGGMVASARDLTRFTQALFAGGLVPDEALNRMVRFREVRKELGKENPAWTGHGLGIARYEIDGREYWGHAGLFIGSQGYALFDPKRRVHIAVLGNVSKFDADRVVEQLGRALEAEAPATAPPRSSSGGRGGGG
jgi:D-alanyl-D-alanine carboxypeptidase